MLGAMVDSPKEVPREFPNDVLNELPKEVLNELLRARGEDDPKLCLRPLPAPPSVATALLNSGLDAGEKGPDETRRPDNPAFAESGEDGLRPVALAGLALRDVDTRYRGGVT